VRGLSTTPQTLKVLTAVCALGAMAACGASNATSGGGTEPATTGQNQGPDPEASAGRDEGAPTVSRCTVQVTEDGRARGTTVYVYTAGTLTEVVAEDPESARRFTTSYTYREGGSAVEVEKSNNQGGEPATALMRYEGGRSGGPVVGERLEGESVVERITWWFDGQERPLKRNHEWLPTTAERTLGLEGRAEGDVCRYDDSGRPVEFDMSLVQERVLEVRYHYEGDAGFPTTISERHVAEGNDGETGPAATVEILSEDPADLTVVWANAPTRATHYRGDCRAVFFPAVCSAASAPGR